MTTTIWFTIGMLFIPRITLGCALIILDYPILGIISIWLGVLTGLSKNKNNE